VILNPGHFINPAISFLIAAFAEFLELAVMNKLTQETRSSRRHQEVPLLFHHRFF